MNLPNKLTMLRVILVPVFMVFAAFGRIGTSDYDRTAMLAAGIIFAAASFTDFLDGYIARKNHLVTDFGKFMDPLADKMLTTAAFIYMVVDGMCHPVVLAVILFREFAVAGVRMIAAERGIVIAANLWGKVKTVLQMVTIIFYYVVQFFVSSPALIAFILIVQLLCWLVAAATVLSGAIYLWQNRACFVNAK
ncbi:MAG TPA: CDP-diacylglycerol--glycerol-3-phosphate 3-phosphatidyltransferase [Candidatus Gemmiger faecigallinarum]|nr:CDP-diacylglycerol--glycerol-3-phosphate 3-phosphatidyltransferase [Candidatus Gemmiger faecigallinarum]